MEPIAYLGLEIKHRELDSRLLIAAHILKAGFAVVFGQQWTVFANPDAFPPGAILFKTVNHIQATYMEKFRAGGHLIAAIDEEVLVCTEDKCFFEVFSPTAAENCDLFFAQSPIHEAAIERRFPTLRGKTKVVGNARIDFLSPSRREVFRPEANDLVQKHGPYILFNTNYGQVNSIWDDENIVVRIAAVAGLVDENDPASIKEYWKKWAWEERNRDEMVALLRWAVANIEGYKIVIRPHPGEKVDFWQNAFGSSDRVVIASRTHPLPWIMGAALTVHTSCTTGLEAAILDKPSVNLVPIPHPTFDYITSAVNPTFTTWQAAAAAIEAFFKSKSGPLTENTEHYAAALTNHFPGYRDGETAQKIGESVCALLRTHGAAPVPDFEIKFRPPGYATSTRMPALKDKFTLTPEEMAKGIDAQRAIFPPGMKVKMAQMDDSLFLLMPKLP